MGDILRLTNPRCDESYVGEDKLSAPPPGRYDAPDFDPGSPWGPNAVLQIKRPWVQTYHGSPLLDSMTRLQAAVYGYIRSFNERGRSCTSSSGTIAGAVGTDSRRVRRILSWLKKNGLIRPVARWKRSGAQDTNSWEARLDL